MKKIFKIILSIVMAVIMVVSLASCRQSNKVSYNISQQADNFNIVRRLAVINARTDKPVFELIGNFALQNTSTNEWAIICQTGENEYKKHYVYLNEWTIYVVEDISGADIDPFHYEINFLPQAFGGVTFVMTD